MLAALALLAMGLRALVPSGYMLAPTAPGVLSVAICTSHGAAAAPIDLNGKSGERDGRKAHDAPCAFAAAAHLAEPSSATLPAPFLRVDFVGGREAASTPAAASAAPPPPATGPPALI